MRWAPSVNRHRRATTVAQPLRTRAPNVGLVESRERPYRRVSRRHPRARDTLAMDDDVPEVVRRAAELAHQLDFPLRRGTRGTSCCHPDVGRLLGLLATRAERIGEIGTGVGYGTAWMVSAMPAGARLVTIEIDSRRAAAAAELFADDPRVEVINGDASELIAEFGPFDLLFADGAGYGSDTSHLRSLFPILSIGGSIVVDDVTPIEALPENSPFRRHDPKRLAFASSDTMRSLEVVAPDLQNSTLVATRLS